ncbi:MAG: PEGA domain-containing protein, partial [Sphingobacteriaceae bacterium]
MRKIYSKKLVLLGAFLLLSVWAFAQTGSISGKVLDEKKLALPGASVTVDGTTLGATTDVDGNYRITGIKAGSASVTANFVGYNPIKKTVTVGSNTNATANFQMAASAQSLNEVVVIGYGTQTRKEVTGAISTVSSKDFQQGTTTTPGELIQGKISGVSVTTNSGAPGAGTTIRIRQGASLNASNEPLIVIDGVPLAPSRNADGTSSVAGVADPLSLINPNDIETFTVLKDAASTAIYGSRASNGVILITTKKGSSGAPIVNFSTKFSVGTTEGRLNVLDGDQIRAYVKAYDVANGTNKSALLGTANTDWQSQIYQHAITTDNNLSISGTTKNIPYRISVGYLDQTGLFTPGLASSGLNPNAPRNPLGTLEDNTNIGDTYRSFGNFTADYRFPFLKGLHANLNLGYDASKGDGSVFIPVNAAQAYTTLGSSYQYHQKNINTTGEFYLNYTSDIKPLNSNINITAGTGYYDFLTTNFNYARYSAAGDLIAGTTPVFLNDKPRYTLISYYSR